MTDEEPKTLEAIARHLKWLEYEYRRSDGIVIHHVQCACITTGCMSALVFENHSTDALDHRLLRLNGWRLDHGRWICGQHPQ